MPNKYQPDCLSIFSSPRSAKTYEEEMGKTGNPASTTREFFWLPADTDDVTQLPPAHPSGARHHRPPPSGPAGPQGGGRSGGGAGRCGSGVESMNHAAYREATVELEPLADRFQSPKSRYSRNLNGMYSHSPLSSDGVLTSGNGGGEAEAGGGADGGVGRGGIANSSYSLIHSCSSGISSSRVLSSVTLGSPADWDVSGTGAMLRTARARLVPPHHKLALWESDTIGKEM